MLDDHLGIFEISLKEFMELSYGNGPIPLPQLASWPSLPPTSLDNFAALPVWGTSTDQTDPPLLPNGHLVHPTTTTVPDADQVAPTTEPTPPYSSHTSSFDTSDSSADFSISLLKPRPTTSGAVILPRIETNVYLDIGLPSGPWNAIQLPCTKSVTNSNFSIIGKGIKPLLLVITVRGATTRQEHDCVCEQCEKRMGNRMGPPGLIDFHSPSNILTASRGMVQVHFTFSCYSRHHRKEDKEYVLEVTLKDASNLPGPIQVARKELPYTFDVRSSVPRTKGPTNCHTQQANIGSSSNVSRKAKRPCPAATSPPTFSAQRVVRPHPQGIEEQIRREPVAGGLPERQRAGRRTNGHVSPMSEPKQQVPIDLQRLPSAIPVFHFSGLPRPSLLVQEVQPRRGSSGGEDRGSLEGGQGSAITMPSVGSLGINPPRSASDAGAKHLSDGSTHKRQSYSAPSFLRQQEPSPFALVQLPSFRIPTNAEMIQTRARIAEREVQIQALECALGGTFEAQSQDKCARLQPIMDGLNSRIIGIRKDIADRLDAFSAERQAAEAAVKGKVADLEAQIHTLKQENSYTARFLTTMANTTNPNALHKAYDG